MLTFKRLRAQNAGCFKELSVPLDKQGSVLIVGENRDEPRTADGRLHSNGSGKSTIPELLTNGLFDVGSKRGFSKNGILNIYHATDCFVEVDFDKGGHEYTIRRYRKHKNHGTSLKFFQDGNDISCQGTRAIPDTQHLIEATLGLTPGEWFGFVYLAQAHTHAMITGKPSEKREYLSRVFSLDVVDDYDKKLKVHLDGLVDKITRLKVLSERRGELKTELTRLNSAQHAADLDERVKRTQRSLREAETQVANAKAAARRQNAVQQLSSFGLDPTGPGFGLIVLDNERKAAKQQLAEYTQAKEDYERRLALTKRLKDDLPDEKTAKSKLEDYSDLLTKLTEASRLQPKLASLDAKIQKLNKPEDPKTERDRIKSKLDKLTTRRDSIHVRLSVLTEDLKKLQALDGQANCPLCLQSLDDNKTKHLLHEKVEERRAASVSHQDIVKRLKECHERFEELEAYITLSKEKADIQKQLDGVNVKEDSTDALRRVRVKQAALQDTLGDVKVQLQIQKDLEKIPEPKHVPTNEEINELKTRVEILTEAKAHDWDTPTVELKAAKVTRKKTQKKLDRLLAERAERDQHKTRVSEVSAELLETKRELNKLEETATSHRVASTMRLALKDLKSLRLHEATRVLTSILPGYVSAMFPGKNVQVKVDDRKADAFDILFEKGGKIIPLDSLSGGQGKKIAIAIILAFTQLTSKRVNVLFADEPYSALDRPSRQLCDELIREAGVSSTFLMTHDLDLLAKRYDQVWRCVMKNNVSKLRRPSRP